MPNDNTKTSSNTSSQSKLTKEEEAKLLEQYQLNFAAINSMNLKQLTGRLQSVSSMLSKFDADQVAGYLQNPSRYEKQLRQLSNYLYNVSAQYKMLIKHMATMPLYVYDLHLIGSVRDYAPKNVEKELLKTSQYVDKLNLPHEISKAMKIAWKEDVFFGYEHETKDSYFIQKLNPEFCKYGTSIEDGVHNFAFDFAYFDTFSEQLSMFPQEFQSKYQLYTTNKQTYKWQELDSDKSVSFKINEELDYTLPPFNTIFESVFDADEYKKLKKAKAKIDNFLLLVQKIPLNKDGRDMDSFLINPIIANQFHSNTGDNLPDGVGLTTTPMEIEAISLDKKQQNGDPVNEAIREIFSDAGISQFLFNTDKSSASGIVKSIMSDEQIVFDVLRQIERWLNRKLKMRKGRIKFETQLLDVTRFNKKEMYEEALKGGTVAQPNIMRMSAIQGVSPNQLYNKAVIENEILELHEILKPFVSSHTQSNKDGEVGREKLDDNDLTDEASAWRETEQAQE